VKTDKNICPDCKHEINEHSSSGIGCIYCPCKKGKEEVYITILEKENKELKQRFQDMKEAAEFWAERHDALYEKYKKFGNEVDIKLDSIKEKLEWLIADNGSMRETLNGIIKDFSNPNMIYFNAVSRAFDCLYQISKNNEKRYTP